MALYAIGDLHLSLGTNKPMDIFRGWDDYVPRLERSWRTLVAVGDTVVIPGDISWAMGLVEAREDFSFLHALPGRKLLLKGNHDYWWTTRRKMDTFIAENGWDSLRIVHNDAVRVGDVAVCGTRGWFYDAEQPLPDADNLVLQREVGRLRMSLEAGVKLGGELVVFLHYPPLNEESICEEILAVLREFPVRRCYYGHVHGPAIRRAFQGERDGVQFRLVAADAVKFTPVLVEG